MQAGDAESMAPGRANESAAGVNNFSHSGGVKLKANLCSGFVTAYVSCLLFILLPRF